MSKLRPPSWVGYAAAALLLAHAALSYYWAAGGTHGMGLLSEGIRDLAEDRTGWFISVIWGVAVLKTGLAILALALIRDWRIPVPRWMPLLIVWAAGAVMTLYAALQIASLAIGGLVLNAGDQLPPAFWAYLLLWMPLWLVIGTTCLLLAWRSTILHREQAV